MTNLKAKRDPETGMISIDLTQAGNSIDLIDEVGAITATLVEETIKCMRQAFEKKTGMDGEAFAEESVDAIARAMQVGFQEGVKDLVKNGILRKDYMEEETC